MTDVLVAAEATSFRKAVAFADMLRDVSYKDWRFAVGGTGTDLWLQVQFVAKDNFGTAEESWTGRKWRLSVHMTKSEVIQTALKAVLAAEEHEAREKFLYRGRAIFGPHFSVDRLWELADAPGAHDVRPEPGHVKETAHA